MILRLTIAYDGGGFRGWAAQPGQRTVRAELEGALGRVLGTGVSLTVAGRTDAGVHATGQVASLQLDSEPPARLLRGVNALLPGDLAVLAIDPAPEGFDARRWARSRTYRYRVMTGEVPHPFERGRALWWRHRLDGEALEACAAALHGRHDFTAFTPTQTDHVRFERRVLNARWARWGPSRPGGAEGIEFVIEADSFMRHMVRILVGTMLEVGGGRRSAEDFVLLLDGAPRPRAGETAPAHGLYLESVRFAEGPVVTGD